MTQYAIQWSVFLPYHVAAELAANPDAELVGRARRVPAAVCFVSISGLTAIGEALDEGGGAAELSRVLHSLFNPIIALVRSYGGIVAGFDGDALTAFFPNEPGVCGPGARRAVACALVVQDQIKRYQDVEIAGGLFALGMRAGLAAGELLCTVVGDEATRLMSVVAGDVLDLAAEAEALAAPGEVVVHQNLLRDLTGARAEPRDSSITAAAFFAILSAEIPDPAPLTLNAPLAEKAMRRAAAFLPAVVARQLAQVEAALVGRLRPVTVVSLGFDGFDYAGDSDVVTRLQRYLAQVFATVERHGGYVSRVEPGGRGGTARILFGDPVAGADDAGRALRCALELRDIRCPRPGGAGPGVVGAPPLGVRIGVATGPVFGAPVGTADRQEYVVIGDVLDLAAGLMHAVVPGRIFVGAPARLAAGPGFAWDGQVELQVRGRAAPVVAAILAGSEAAEPDAAARAAGGWWAVPPS